MRKLLHFSEAASLAIHSLEIIAREPGQTHTVRDLAERLKGSENHLAKVFQRLSKSGLLQSYRGPGGGFVLTRKPDEITFRDIFSAIEGELDMGCCPMMKDKCPFTECLFSGVLDRFQDEFRKFIQDHTLSDFINKGCS